MPDTIAEYRALRTLLDSLNTIECINLYALMCISEARMGTLMTSDPQFMKVRPSGVMIDVTYLRATLALVLEAKLNWRRELGCDMIDIRL